MSLALDATTPTNPTEEAAMPRRLKAHIFIDATECARTNGETGAITRSGI